MRMIVLLLALTAVAPASAQFNLSRPNIEPEFRIDGATERASLLFVAGMSYGLSFLNDAYRNAGVQVGICLPEDKEYIGTQEIVDLLNEADQDEFTASDATSYVVSELARRYRCR
ncbi:MAG: hypothetical protein ACU85V_04730 [Gammaproteobacteria bacterium]